jgi:hypothetical protein
MPKCAVVADVDPCLSAVTAHLLSSVFDTEVFRSQIRRHFDFYVSQPADFDCALAVEIVGSKIGYFQAPDEIAHEHVAVLITASGIAANDNFAGQLLKHDVPVLRLGEFHPLKIDFANFNERDAGHSFAIAIAESSVGLSNYLLNFLVPAK